MLASRRLVVCSSAANARKKAYKRDGKGKKKKVKLEQEVDDEKHEDEDTDCVSINKIPKKYDDEDGNKPEANGSGVFDAIPSGIQGGDIFAEPEQSFRSSPLFLPSFSRSRDGPSNLI
jgi:hypothetical protein